MNETLSRVLSPVELAEVYVVKLAGAAMKE